MKNGGTYAKAWSQPDEERDTILANLVSEDIAYADPNGQVTGHAAFFRAYGAIPRQCTRWVFRNH